MNEEYANELLHDISHDFSDYQLENLKKLALWIYDQGWSKSREDLEEEQNPTDEAEWRKTR